MNNDCDGDFDYTISNEEEAFDDMIGPQETGVGGGMIPKNSPELR